MVFSCINGAVADNVVVVISLYWRVKISECRIFSCDVCIYPGHCIYHYVVGDLS